MAGPSRIDELRKKFDENPRRYFAPLANEYRKIGDFEQAIFICQEFLPQQPGHMSGHIVYGQALFESGRHDEARSVFETALALDPENLIALRHLGDIARALGDSETARAWYRRVLDSDPRNEEIAGILTALDADASGAPVPFAPAPAAASAQESTPDQSAAAGAVEMNVPAAPSVDPIVTEPLSSGPSESSFDDLAKLFTSAPSESPPAPAEPVPPGSSGAFTFVHEGEDVLGRAAQMAEQPAESSHSPLAGLSTFGEPGNSAPAAPSSFLEGLTTSEQMVAPEQAAQAQPPAPPEQPAAPEPGTASSDAAAPPTVASNAFVTTTMAELYVQQGHVDRAIDVYRQLVAMRPNDAALSARLRELEPPAQPAASAPSGEPPAVADVVAEAGPTIRDFLTGIAGFRARTHTSDGSFSEPPVSTPAPPPVDLPPEEPRQQETVGSSLHNLFAGVERDAVRGQAPTLGDLPLLTDSSPAADSAPRPGAEPAPIRGRPATPATTELSLDHVFRHATPAAGTGSQSSFSFDQFFSQQAQQDVTAADAEPSSESTGGQGDDIQQFNAWLEGLKKS